MSFIPLKYSLEFMAPGTALDRFGNPRPVDGEWVKHPVASWWVDMTEEKQGESVLRTVDMLHVHMRPEDAPPPDGQVRTPDGQVWQVQGHVQDFNHGWHGWSPGLVVVDCRKVEG